MEWFDIGVNLLDKRFEPIEVLQRAADKAVNKVCVISSDLKESSKAQSFVENTVSPCSVYYTAGVHPHQADHASEQDLLKLKQFCADKSMVAIGECGLDFNRNFSTPENQLAVFEAQLKIAAENHQTVYLHERDAFEPQIALLKRYLPDIPSAIVHCFTGTRAQLDAYLELGCYIGITGWVCDDKRGADLQDAVKAIPLQRLLLETDAPYLFPKNVRPRMKNNEPCCLPHVGEKVAELTQKSLETIARQSYQNALSAFRIKC
ncbi:TatD family hydrolase [Brumicola blandensis]|uniref:TatD family hydrolase n=1 Tax=Brumicola blandensis TaxID=3075611 RepID=A0AAW8QYY9_9ALTE|nr:TatD family hydrolase [Alteromonas sp. W409]MDT0582378.1 TatD family hydrolase [Alteromonas sp. W409]